METLTISKSNLKEIIKESVLEVILEERVKLNSSAPKKEMADIEMHYKNPSDYNKKNFKDMTAWVYK